jgi:hypothetical protein
MARLCQIILLLFLKENFKTHCFFIPSAAAGRAASYRVIFSG